MSPNWLHSRWFALLVLICTAASGFLWYFDSTPVILPLILGGLPLILLYLGDRRVPLPHLSSLLFVLFFLSAAVGVWAAYDQEAAIHKFWILFSAGMIFFALAAQPVANLRLVFWGLSILGLAIAVYYFLANDPSENPADLAFISTLKLAWAEVRPDANWSSPNSNFVGGILALLILCTVSVFAAARRTHRATEALLAVSILVVQIVALGLTSSRAAWTSLGIGIAIWLWWKLSRSISTRWNTSRSMIFRRGLLITAGFAITLVIIFPSQLFALADALPGVPSAATRAGLYTNAVDLVPVYWLTGGGLNSFAGLYSQYILDIPFLYFKYSHNLFLDVAIEQGLFGLAAFLGIFGIAGIALLQGFSHLHKSPSGYRQYYMAVFAALVVVLVNGTLDDPFYGERSTPLLFVIPGLAYLLTTALPVDERTSQVTQPDKPSAYRSKYIVSALFFGLLGVILVGLHPLAAAVEANLGAVEMARIDLANFPAERWQDLSEDARTQPARAHLLRALQHDPLNRTANYRLGLLAMRSHDYPKAIGYLETAHEIDPAHRGIWKTLGYSYVWSGEFAKAVDFLRSIPESERELDSYASWWYQQRKPDLATHAARMVNLLNEAHAP